MLTIDAILSKKFDKAMGGYRQDDVDAFLQQIAVEFERLQNENRDLEDKLEILAEKIEQYRKDETGLKTALIGAQKLGEGLLRDAKNQVEQMRRDALHDLETTKLQLERDIQRERYELSQLQKETANFKNRLMSMYVAQMDLIRNIPVPDELLEPVVKPEEQEAEEPQPIQETEPEKPVETPAEEPVQTAEPPALLFDDEDDKDDIVLCEEAFDEADEEDDEEDEDEELPVYQERGYSIRSAQEDSRFGPLKFGEGFEVANLPDEDEAPRKRFSFKGKFGR